ncbi:MAG: hypothetical protein CMK59_09565 [Proteobacteria bacterium]|nr:hypothetical protein [Pseudomonadota bacterium]
MNKKTRDTTSSASGTSPTALGINAAISNFDLLNQMLMHNIPQPSASNFGFPPSFGNQETQAFLMAHHQNSNATYEIQSGDSLWSIATSHNIDTEALKAANPSLGDVIHPGMLIKIPASQSNYSSSSSNNSTPEQNRNIPPQNNNVLIAMDYLITKMNWEAEFAAAWLGQAVVETGDPDLKDLDVVEHSSGEGRGMLQYTDDRRGPYDNARWQAIQNGENVNDIRWQIDYALNKDNPGLYFDDLYKGLTDPNSNYTFQPNWGTALGISPSNVRYSDKYRTANELMRAYGEDKIAGYTRALTGEYTRPGEPHLDRRLKAARDIFKDYKQWKNSSNNQPTIT